MKYTYYKHLYQNASEESKEFIAGIENVFASSSDTWEEVVGERVEQANVVLYVSPSLPQVVDNVHDWQFTIDWYDNHRGYISRDDKDFLIFDHSGLEFSYDFELASVYAKSMHDSEDKDSKKFFAAVERDYAYSDAYQLGQAVGKVLSDLMLAESYVRANMTPDSTAERDNTRGVQICPF